MNNIEVEVRSFISKKKYNKLLEFFKKEAKFIKKDNQKSFYFDCGEDLRIQKNDFYSKVWMKKGNIHDDSREEIEIKFNREDFEKLERLFLSLGFNIEIKWFRKRYQFKWGDVIVCLDCTKGYGYIIELEKMVSEKDREKEYRKLKEKLESLKVDISSKKEFSKKFKYYKENWKKLVK